MADVSPRVEHVASSGHGGDAGAVAAALGVERSTLIDLSMSMNPVAPDVRRVLADRLDSVVDYPDETAATQSLADAIGVEPALLVLTNGGSEAIALVASTMDAGHVVQPEFSLYARHLDALDPTAPRWRSNPSNPLGRLVQDGESAAVWDEAFWPIATGTWTDRRLDGQHVWRLGSLTKLWACPGLRLGYLIAPDLRSADIIRQRQPRWSVSSLALAIVEPMLAQTDLVGWSTAILTSCGTSIRKRSSWPAVPRKCRKPPRPFSRRPAGASRELFPATPYTPLLRSAARRRFARWSPAST